MIDGMRHHHGLHLRMGQCFLRAGLCGSTRTRGAASTLAFSGLDRTTPKELYKEYFAWHGDVPPVLVRVVDACGKASFRGTVSMEFHWTKN